MISSTCTTLCRPCAGISGKPLSNTTSRIFTLLSLPRLCPNRALCPMPRPVCCILAARIYACKRRKPGNISPQWALRCRRAKYRKPIAAPRAGSSPCICIYGTIWLPESFPWPPTYAVCCGKSSGTSWTMRPGIFYCVFPPLTVILSSRPPICCISRSLPLRRQTLCKKAPLSAMTRTPGAIIRTTPCWISSGRSLSRRRNPCNGKSVIGPLPGAPKTENGKEPLPCITSCGTMKKF